VTKKVPIIVGNADEKKQESIEEKAIEPIVEDKDKVKAEAEAEAEAEVKVKVEAKNEVKAKVEAEAKNEVKAEAEVEVEVEAKNEVKAKVEDEIREVVETKVEPAPEAPKTQEANRSRLADRFNDSGRMVEQLKKVRQDEAITSGMHARPITDIAAAIGINDKFYFIRELFSGDNKAYIDTIGRLNSAASLGEAMRILDESTVMGSDPAAQSSFVDVVRRKFNING